MKWGRKKEATTINNEPITKKPSTFSLTNLSSWLSKLKPHPKCTTPKPPAPPAPAPTPTPSPTRTPIPRRLSASDADPPPTRLATHTRPHSFGSELEFPLPSPSTARRPRRRKPPTHDLKPIKTGPVSGTGTTPDPIRPGRRSFNGGRIRPRVRVCSPRLAHPNPVLKERGGGVGLERYAVVKSSVDPTRDFRESMVEMIWEKGIGQPEELERLLACYLALNSEEHHDLIVKVFRQVWFDLS